MKILPLILTSAVLLLSCDKKESTVSETIPNEPETMVDSTSAKTQDSVVTITPEKFVIPTPEKAVVAKSGQSGKPALNPEHGKPFHRCDIEVGAPIDSAPKQNPTPQVAAPQMQNSNTSFNTNPIAPSAVAAPASVQASPVQAAGPKPANNPAHGQPHHRCDLQVGAPLT
jgi:hypothetical protein